MKVQRLFSAVTMAQGLRWLGLLIALIAVAVAAYLWMQQVRVEQALRYKCDLPEGAQIAADCLEEVTVPVNRQFDVVTQQAAAVGRWTVHPVRSGELLHPAQLTDQQPDRFRFSSGALLPEGMHGYYMSVPGVVLNAVSAGHLLSLALADPLGDQLVVIFDKALILDKDGSGIFLGLNMAQVAAIESLFSEEMKVPEGQPAPWLVWTITQGANPDLPALAVFRMELKADVLDHAGGRP